MIRSLGKSPDHEDSKIEMFEVTDPQELANACEQRAQADRNFAWWKEHMADMVAPANRGKYVCIAGQEGFIADRIEEALALATAAHPEDYGRITHYIPKESRKMWKIYAAVSCNQAMPPVAVARWSGSRNFAEQR